MLDQAKLSQSLIGRLAMPLDPARAQALRGGLTLCLTKIAPQTSKAIALQGPESAGARAALFASAVAEGQGAELAFNQLAAAALAAGYTYDATFEDLLPALSVSYDLAQLLAGVLGGIEQAEPGHYLPIAIAVLHLAAQRGEAPNFSHAIGLSSSMTLATRLTKSAGSDPWLLGLAASNGAQAAAMAALGVTAAPRGLEGPRGWMVTLGFDPKAGATRDLEVTALPMGISTTAKDLAGPVRTAIENVSQEAANV